VFDYCHTLANVKKGLIGGNGKQAKINDFAIYALKNNFGQKQSKTNYRLI
jgi:hypothetical protein